MTFTDDNGKPVSDVDSDEQTKARNRIVNEMVALSSLSDSKYV